MNVPALPTWKTKRLGPAEFVFALVATLGLAVGHRRFLVDPGTFWHLRLGREILRTGRVPRVDFLTTTRSGTPWVDQSWLFDAGYAAVVDHLGWSAVVILTALLLGSLYAALTRWLLARWVSEVAAAATGIIAFALGSIHFLARPHLFTFVGVLATLVLCDLVHRGHRAWAWLLPPLVALWANLHGGFLAGPLIVFTAAAFELLDGITRHGRRRYAARFLVTGVACLAAALVNPYGPALYAHVARLLVSSGVTDLIQEYQPVAWGRKETLLLEAVVVALILLPRFTGARASAYDLAHALVWMHLGLASLRNLPLFAIAVAPVLAPLLDAALHRSAATGAVAGIVPGVSSRLGRRLLGCGLLAALLVAVLSGGPDPRTWPFQGLAALDGQPVDAALFHEQDWGGLIESESHPPRRARLDDRFELWGRAPILEYVEALRGGGGWDDLLARERFTLAWLRPDRGLARRLDRDPAWQAIHRDEVSVLYRRRVPALTATR